MRNDLRAGVRSARVHKAGGLDCPGVRSQSMNDDESVSNINSADERSSFSEEMEGNGKNL